jgi:pimeloyl-ACP methyl ester carboxylesterase
MEKITSTDGTQIAYQHTGTGPPLILVHGTGGSATRWAPVVPALAEHFSVYAVDRRGRGESSDSDTYAVEREYEDIAAVVDATGEPAYLLGHSFGGIIAVEAAMRTRNLRKLILYEPPIPVTGTTGVSDEIINRLQALLAAGDREKVLTTFLIEVVKMPPDELTHYRALPAWPARIAAAHTLPRELLAAEHYPFKRERFKELQIPTLLLLGGDSPTLFKTASEALDAALPDSRIVIMPGQQHIAIDTAPKLFVQEVLTFLNEPG